MGHHHRAGTRPRPLPSLRKNPRQPSLTSRTRMPQHRQAHRRGRIRHQRCGHLLRILRRSRHQGCRLRQPRPRQRDVPFSQGAGRHRRTNYPVELYTPHGGLEACTRHRSRLPPGVVNIITGFGESCGAPLVQHPDVNKIAFTGSAAVGKIIVKQAADTVKRVTLELGGKSPNIFFADADFEAAIDGALFGVFINQGEVCSAGSRILVQKSIYNKFVEAMAEKAKKIKIGPPLERETKMGPLVSKEQYDRVRQYQELGKSEARLAAGGGRPASQAKGYYVEPTIFADVDNSARISREEIFGPVAVVIPFDGEAAAIRIANDTPYGLAAAVWSRDIFRAFRIVKALRAGIVWVNHMQPTYVEAPWGGYKQSGFGRELGPWGIEEYLETKQVYINLNEQPIGWY